MCSDVTAEGEHGGKVDLKHLVPVIVRELLSWVSSLNAAAVE
jgi:hypothetical protein